MARYTISNGVIRATVDSHGAELRSLLCGEREYMWQADGAYWARTAPVLFPLVGALVDGQAKKGDTVFHMGQHGFARDLEFTLTDQTDTSLEFCLRSDEQTKERFPYEFVLKIRYDLSGRTLRTTWRVENPAAESLWFSIGGHPAFNCRMGEDSYRIYEQTNDGLQPVSTHTYKLLNAKGVLEQKDYALATPDGRLPIQPELFDGDALISLDTKVCMVSLADAKGMEYLWVKFDADCPNFGLWSPTKKNAPFVCIEPWYGVADFADASGDWTKKAYIRELKSAEVFERGYEIMV